MQGLDNAIEAIIPEAEHRLCVKHLHANWSKKYPGKEFKELMWEAARAANTPYFDAAMGKIRNKSVEAFNALNRLNRRKWTRCAFRRGLHCDMLTSNHAEAFNICIMRARDQPVLTLLNTVHQIIMKRITVEHRSKQKWAGMVCPRVHKLIEVREKLTCNYSVLFCGNLIYEVSTGNHFFTVDLHKLTCTCELWQLGGIPCIHAVCVYQKENKDPRRFVEDVFLRERFLRVYSHTLLPLGGPTMWPKTNYNPILPPDVKVLPGRPKKSRKIDPQELREKKDKAEAERAKKSKENGGVYKASRAGGTVTCSHCKKKGHNKKTCPDLLMVGLESDDDVDEVEAELNAPARETMSQPSMATSEQGDGPSSRPSSSSQPQQNRRSSKKRKRSRK